MKVLIADDDPVQLRLLETLVGGWDYEVSTAPDGTQAYAILEAEDAPKVAILDWQMPGLDGYETTRLIREHQARTGRRVPIMAMTANRPSIVASTLRSPMRTVVTGRISQSASRRSHQFMMPLEFPIRSMHLC